MADIADSGVESLRNVISGPDVGGVVAPTGVTGVGGVDMARTPVFAPTSISPAPVPAALQCFLPKSSELPMWSGGERGEDIEHQEEERVVSESSGEFLF